MKQKKNLKEIKILKVNYDQGVHLGFSYRKALLGKMIKRGLKLKAISLYRKIKLHLKERFHVNPDLLIEISFLKITPLIYFKAFRIGRTVQGVPLPINELKQVVYPMKCFFKLF